MANMGMSQIESNQDSTTQAIEMMSLNRSEWDYIDIRFSQTPMPVRNVSLHL